MPLPRPSESSSRWHDHNSTPSMGRQRPKSARRKRLESPISLRPLNCAAQSTFVSFLTAGMAGALRPGPFPAEFGAAAPTVSCQKSPSLALCSTSPARPAARFSSTSAARPAACCCERSPPLRSRSPLSPHSRLRLRSPLWPASARASTGRAPSRPCVLSQCASELRLRVRTYREIPSQLETKRPICAIVS
jgi:hypothetical protein